MNMKKIIVYGLILFVLTNHFQLQAKAAETTNITLDMMGTKSKTITAPEKKGYKIEKISHKLSKKGIVTVKKNKTKLKITAKKKGSVTLTETIIYQKNGKKKKEKKKYNILVSKDATLVDISLSLAGKKTSELSPPKLQKYKVKKISYNLSKKGIVTVTKSKNKLMVNAKKTGNVKLTETLCYKNGNDEKNITIIYNINVTKKNIDIKEISLDKEKILLKQGETALLVATFKPKNATTEKVVFSSSNIKVAKVENATDTTATITAVGTGSTVITARVGFRKATCKVVVEDSYTYKITPLLAPFNNYFYVETDNPDVSAIRFVDKDSKYLDEYKDYKYAAIVPSSRRFLDVQYENRDTGRVKGGYIFSSSGAYIDGGDLTMQMRENTDSYFYSDYEDSSTVVTCPEVIDYKDYLINTYTTGSMTFFEKMDAVENGLYKLALYPRSTLDTSKPNKDTPYPFLAVSPYPELSLNDWYLMYDYSEDGLLLNALYPYVVDSLGFPSVMYNIAKKLDPGCSIEWGSLHYMIDVTKDGVTRSYGGAGAGGTDPLLSNRVEILFKFDGSGDDYAINASIENLANKRNEYGKYAREDMEVYHDLLCGDTYKKTVSPGSWLRVTMEGFSIGSRKAYAYVTQGASFTDDYKKGYVSSVSEVWIDGRYINVYNYFEKGAKFEDYPTADIMIRNMTYTDKNGNVHTGDVRFNYDSETETWKSDAYWNYYWHTSDEVLPDEFILTKDEVAELNVDKNTNVDPETGFIYDSSVAPGTPFINQ